MGRLTKAIERIQSRDFDYNMVSEDRAIKMESKSKVDEGKDLFNLEIPLTQLDQEHLATRRIVTTEVDPSVRTAYKMLRTRILQTMRTNGWSSLAITSAGQGDGKTLTAINLAISLAGDVNHHVCLVDLDMKRSSVAKYLGLEPEQGISNVLKNESKLKNIIVKPNIERLFVIPNVTVEDQTSELLSSPEMRHTASQLIQNPNRIIIYDMPPILAADEMLAFSPYVDAILVVVAEGITPRTDAMKVRELLADMNVIGTLLNRSDEKTAAYY